MYLTCMPTCNIAQLCCSSHLIVEGWELEAICCQNVSNKPKGTFGCLSVQQMCNGHPLPSLTSSRTAKSAPGKATTEISKGGGKRGCSFCLFVLKEVVLFGTVFTSCSSTSNLTKKKKSYHPLHIYYLCQKIQGTEDIHIKHGQ